MKLMKINFVILFYFTFHYQFIFGQGEANIWYFGQNAGVDFNGGAPVALTNGALNTSEGCATLCDKNGNLLFYTDGIRVWNRNHVQMPNGFGLLGHPSSAQSAIIVPKPGNNNWFYIFTVDFGGNINGFRYSEVDISLNGGLGDIITATKNTLLFTPSTEKVTAVKHANGLYVWVIAHGLNNNRYYAYMVDCNGVNNPVISDVGSVEGAPGWGYLTASPNGLKLASAMRAVGFELLDFNPSTGVVSNPILLGNGGSCYGISFSPDNNLLYGLSIQGGALLQWNLQAGTPANIIASVVNLGNVGGTGNPYRGGAIQQGPDRKLYIPQYQQPFFIAINNPNVIGVGCNVQNNAVDLSGRNAVLGLPPFIMSFFDTIATVSFTGTCVGGATNFTISSNTTFLDSVRWFFDDPASGISNTSTVLSPSHTFTSAGIFNVQLIRYIDCISDTTTQPITILPPPSGTQNISICPGSTYTLPDGNVVSSPGTYNDTISTSAGCDSIVITNLSTGNVNVDAGTGSSVCPNQPAQLNATGGLIYSWSPTTGLNDPNIANPIATITSTTTYTVISQTAISNTVVNGDFSAGNNGFISAYAYTPPPNTSQGQYWVSTNAQPWNGGMAACGDHTTGSGNMLLVNGATTPNISVYCQTVNVVPNTDYAFSAWLTSLSANNPAQLQFSINGTLLGNVFTASTTTCVWQQFYEVWNSGSNTTATICIVNQNTIASGNDFALDDISFSPLCTGTDTVTITVFPVYRDTFPVDICYGGSYTLPGGTTVTTAGFYTDTLFTANNCDSIVVTNISILPIISFTIDTFICEGDTYLAGGTPQNSAGTYYDTVKTALNCDSLIITNLYVIPPIFTVIDTAICEGESYMAGGQLQTTSGTYIDSLFSAIGCDSIVTTNLTVNPVSATSVFDSICQFESYVLPSGNSVSMTGIYIDTLQNIYGCDSIITTDLYVIPLDTVYQQATICYDETFFAGGQNQNTAGVYYDIIPVTTGCDTVLTTTLSVINPLYTDVDSILCLKDFYFMKGETFKGPYGFNDTLTSTLTGCDSILIYNIQLSEEDSCNCEALYVPNAFSPNGDGLNDVLNVYGGCFEKFHFIIYNRLGDKMFETFDQNSGWNGRFNGNILDPSVFVYYIKAVTIGNNIVNKKGSVTLIK
jgi:gliding motility-associated-like protein